MTWHYPLIDRIASGRDPWLTDHPSMGPALGAAWATADPAGRRRLIDALLRTGGTAGAAILIERLPELDRGSQDELACQIDRLTKPLRRLLSGEAAPAAAVHALELITRAAAPLREPANETTRTLDPAVDLAYLVTGRLRDADPAVRHAAGRCLFALVEQQPRLEGRSLDRLTQVVGEAVARFEHHRHPAAVQAWLGLGSRALTHGGPALEALSDPNHPAVGPLRDQLVVPDEPRVRRGLVGALALPTLALAAVQGLRHCVSRDVLIEAILGQEHLLALPTVRRGLARAGDAAGLLPPDLADSTPPTEAWHDRGGGTAWVAWVSALPLTDLCRATRYRRLLGSRQAQTRLTALRALFDRADEVGAADPPVQHEALEAARHLAVADDHPAVARLAGTWWLGQRPGPTDLAQLMRSAHGPVRDAAGLILGTQTCTRLWREGDRMPPAARRAAWQASVRLDPSARARLELQGQLDGPPAARARGIATLLDAGRVEPASRPNAVAGEAA
jgi:hypothetical protein